MTYWNAESKLYTAIGCFSTIGQLIFENIGGSAETDTIDYNALSTIGNSMLPGQCQAFLTTATEFIWFVEEREIIAAPPDSPDSNPLVSFGIKKVYPAKITGLNLPLIRNGYFNINSVTMRWRDGLIRSGNPSIYFDEIIESYRPGFGEVIVGDLERPQKEVAIQTNNLGLPDTYFQPTFSINNGITGPLGRLMSIASYVNPELAQKYDDSKKKRKSPNEQDYQDPPQYPPYTPYEDNSGY